MVPGYEGRYSVSDQGQVWSHRRHRLMKLNVDRDGYTRVSITDGSGPRGTAVHVLVARAFLGEPKPGQQVRHIDGDETNNTPGNLAWGTVTENARDRTTHGTQVRGVTNGRAVLDENTVRAIRNMKAEGWAYRQVADYLGLAHSTVHHVITRRTWKHIE